MKEGNPIQSVWTDIPVLRKKERLNYPTEKPVLLLERLTKTFTDESDMVADFFCGCGTTLEAALNLKRNLNENLITIAYPFDEIPKDLTKMNPRDFQRNCVLFVEGVPNAKMSNDNGIDGIRIKDGAIIQVKQSKKIAGHHIRELLGAMTANRTKKGIFVAYSFIDSARNLVNKIKKDGYEIELKTVAQLKKESDKRQREKPFKETKFSKEKLIKKETKDIEKKIIAKHKQTSKRKKSN